MSTLYVLQLEYGKWYVGKTNDVARRYAEHKSGIGSEWTRLYKPIKMVQTRQITSAEDETTLTKQLMKQYGIDNVRGGPFCQKELPEYVRRTIQLEHQSASDACYTCGEKGHFAKDCCQDVWYCEYCDRDFPTEQEGIRHESICKEKDQYEYSQLNERDFGACFRCGRRGHWLHQCYARTTVDGDELDSDYEPDSDDDDFYSCESE